MFSKSDTPFCSIGPRDLTLGTLLPHYKSTILTVTDNLFMQGIIEQNLIAMSFEPTTSETVYGELTFGGTDSTKYTGDAHAITWTLGIAVAHLILALCSPVTTTFPSSVYWGLELSFRYGDATPILDTNAGILDTGSTLIYIATGKFQTFCHFVPSDS
jgi:cathepsin E